MTNFGAALQRAAQRQHRRGRPSMAACVERAQAARAHSALHRPRPRPAPTACLCAAVSRATTRAYTLAAAQAPPPARPRRASSAKPPLQDREDVRPTRAQIGRSRSCAQNERHASSCPSAPPFADLAASLSTAHSACVSEVARVAAVSVASTPAVDVMALASTIATAARSSAERPNGKSACRTTISHHVMSGSGSCSGWRGNACK
eukprot:6198817-Pleurochrysis_carterae.AAC.1